MNGLHGGEFANEFLDLRRDSCYTGIVVSEREIQVYLLRGWPEGFPTTRLVDQLRCRPRFQCAGCIFALETR